MIRKLLTRPLVLLALFLFVLFVIPEKGAEALRSSLIANLPIASKSIGGGDSQLELENQLLRQQLDRVISWLSQEREIEGLWKQYVGFSGGQTSFLERRAACLQEILERQIVSLPAKVIFREPSSLSSSVWINVGTRDNSILGRDIVAVDSPVVVGRSLVGVVEKVCEKRSRVRLVVDPSLAPSVRVVRGTSQNLVLHERLGQVCDLLKGREDLLFAADLQKAMEELRAELEQGVEEQYLAKGIVTGSRIPEKRLPRHLLLGKGFNYDFADVEGEARILRTGETLSGSKRSPLIQTGDLLVTTGLDGVFPADLHVGVVTSIYPLQEGGTSYSLEAKPLAPEINSLSEVYVLPPSG